MKLPINKKASTETLQVQLQILNERSRWYSNQLWQVPFLYIAATGALLGQLIDKQVYYLPLGMIVTGLLGGVVFIHMRKLQNGEGRAVRALRDIEEELGLEAKAEHRKDYTGILLHTTDPIWCINANVGNSIFTQEFQYL